MTASLKEREGLFIQTETSLRVPFVRGNTMEKENSCENQMEQSRRSFSSLICPFCIFREPPLKCRRIRVSFVTTRDMEVAFPPPTKAHTMASLQMICFTAMVALPLSVEIRMKASFPKTSFMAKGSTAFPLENLLSPAFFTTESSSVLSENHTWRKKCTSFEKVKTLFIPSQVAGLPVRKRKDT